MPSKSTAHSAAKEGKQSVEAYLDALQHPHKEGVRALRKAILGVDTRIQEEIKWNAPSFCLGDHFATFRLHPGSVFQLILHTGARAKGTPKQFHLDAPPGLLKWAAKDCCILAFESAGDAMAKRAVVTKLVKEWIAQL